MTQYREGTVTVTNNSSTVDGSGTRWQAAGIQAGHWFTIRDQGITYTVAAVLSDTQLVLSGAYQGSSAAGQFYLIHTDFTPRGYAVPGPGDVDATIIIRRSIYEIDADMTASLGSSTGTARQIHVADISDLNSSTALSGQVFTKLASGSYGFSSPASLSVTLVNLATSGTDVGQVYAGTATNGNHQFRAIQVVGASLAENPATLTITVPAPGEVNTFANIGTAQAESIVAPKTGTTLNAYGLRGTNGVSIVRSGNDLVVSGSGTGGGTTSGGEANTAENLGTAGTNVVRVFSDKLGVSLRLRSILFNTDHFTLSGEATGQYTVNLRRQRLADSPDVAIGNAVAGQIIRLESDNIWRPQTLPAAGIPNVQADPTPRLGGDLVLAGRRILGIADTISGMIESPEAKNYTLVLQTSSAISLTSMAATTETGSVKFFLFLGTALADNPDGSTSAPISGTTAANSVGQVVPGDAIQVPTGSRITLRLVPQTTEVSDFSFSVAYLSA